jgi:hypothetical protein
LRIGYHPNPYQVSILRRELNGNMKALLGKKQCIDHSSFTSIKEERAKLYMTITLAKTNNLFVDVESVQRTMVRLKFTT